MIELIVVKGPTAEGSKFQLNQGQSFTIGRASECDIKLSSTGVSKQHCSLTPLSGFRIEIEDLGSANGTYVNGLLIKKHVLKPGDTITISQYVLQIRKNAPQLVVQSSPRGHSKIQNMNSFPRSFSGPAGMTNVGSFGQSSPHSAASETEKVNPIYSWFDRTIFPIADQMAAKANVTVLLFGTVFLFTFAVAILSINPFKDRANFRVQEQSIEVAKLYARQIARINLDAIIDQRYSNLVVNLDVGKKRTPGIVEALILDRVNAQILAPPEKLGQPLPNDSPAAAIAIAKETEHVGIDENSNLAFVSIPIIVNTPDGVKAVASAFVRFNYQQNQFSFSSVLDQALNSILISLTFGWLVFAMIYRWSEGTLQVAADSIQKALRNNETSISLPIASTGADNLAQEIGFALAKASSASNNSASSESAVSGADWAISAVNNTGGAAAALDGRLTILAWNPRMALILGIQESVAVGAEISQASRDVAFETAVRELAQDALLSAWRNASRQIDLGGRPHLISVVWGGYAFLVNIDAVGGDS